jgi:glucose/arabinose dehydrogenase
MNRNILQATLAAVLVAACQSNSSAQPKTDSTRPFTVAEVAKFSTPWAMDFLPGSGVPLTSLALVTEKEGKLWLVDVRNGSRREVSGVPAIHVAGQGGLGDVVVHPDFAGNRRVYLSYVEAGEGGTSGAVLGYGTLELADANKPALRDFRIIWRQQPKLDGDGHFSHRVTFGPDGLLYLTSGERQHFDPAQDMSGNLGKVLRLTAEGAPAPGNPWASRGGIAAQFWTIGHRNLLGIAFAPDGRLWETEMGPRGGDELNLIVPGRNYGWPRASNGSHYDGRDIPDHKPGDGFEPPKAWWNPSISPGGLMIYTGDQFPAWKGDALIPALSGEALIRVDIDGDKAAKADQWDMGERIRAVEQGPNGSVYLLEDEGRLLRLDPVK